MPFCIGSKFAQNYSVSKGLWDNQHFWFPIKLKMVGKIREIWHFSEAIYQRFLISKWSKISLKLLIALSLTVFKINNTFNFRQNSRWRAKNFVEISLSHTVSEISVFTFHAEIQDGHQKWRESDFCEKSPVHSGHPEDRKLRRNPSIS